MKTETQQPVIGLHAAMVERRYGLPEALHQAGAFGAQSYELDLGIGAPGESWEERRTHFQAQLPQLRAAAAEAGVLLSSLCLGVLWQFSLASPDEAERRLAVQVARDGVALAAGLGARAVLLPAGQPAGVEPVQARATLIRSLRACLPVAEARGVVLAVENICQPLLSGAEELIEVVDAVDSSACGVYYDVGNATFIDHDPVREIGLLGERIVRMHLKDTRPIPRPQLALPNVRITGDFEVWRRRTAVTIGAGEVPMAEVREALAAVGYNGGFIIEVPQPPETVAEGCRANLAAARRLFEPHTRTL